MAASAAQPAPPKSVEKTVSLEDYFDFEYKAELRHEYIGGQIRAMAYSTPNHGGIQTNLMDLLGPCSKAKGCKRYTERMVLVPECGKGVFYPDLVIVCGEEQFHTHKKKMKATLNPTVVIEILSDSTEMVDRYEKWACYRKIASLQQYVMVEQNRPGLHSFRRQNGGDRDWKYEVAERPDEAIEVNGCAVRVADVYDGI